MITLEAIRIGRNFPKFGICGCYLFNRTILPIRHLFDYGISQNSFLNNNNKWSIHLLCLGQIYNLQHYFISLIISKGILLTQSFDIALQYLVVFIKSLFRSDHWILISGKVAFGNLGPLIAIFLYHISTFWVNSFPTHNFPSSQQQKAIDPSLFSYVLYFVRFLAFLNHSALSVDINRVFDRTFIY